MTGTNKTVALDGLKKVIETTEKIESKIAENDILLNERSNELMQKFQEIKDYVANCEYPIILMDCLPKKISELAAIEDEHMRIIREKFFLEELIK